MLYKAISEASPLNAIIQRLADAVNIIQAPKSRHQTVLTMLFQKLLGFINLCCQVWASSTIRVVQHHERAVVLANLLLCHSTLTISWSVYVGRNR